MEWTVIIRSLLSLVFVLGLLFVCVWGLKYLKLKTDDKAIFKKFGMKSRIKILQSKRIDIKTSVVLLEVDDKEFAVLLSAGQPLLLSSETKKTIDGDKVDEI